MTYISSAENIVSEWGVLDYTPESPEQQWAHTILTMMDHPTAVAVHSAHKFDKGPISRDQFQELAAKLSKMVEKVGTDSQLSEQVEFAQTRRDRIAREKQEQKMMAEAKNGAERIRIAQERDAQQRAHSQIAPCRVETPEVPEPNKTTGKNFLYAGLSAVAVLVVLLSVKAKMPAAVVSSMLVFWATLWTSQLLGSIRYKKEKKHYAHDLSVKLDIAFSHASADPMITGGSSHFKYPEFTKYLEDMQRADTDFINAKSASLHWNKLMDNIESDLTSHNLRGLESGN